MASVVLMVREGRDLLQHMQLSPWPENLPAVSICVGARSLLVQTDSAEGGIKFLVELEEGEEGEEGFTDMVEYLAGSRVPRVSVRCLAEWRDGRLGAILTETALLEAEEALATMSEKEVEELKVDQELMTCVRRKVKQLAGELGILQQPESEEIGVGEEEDSQFSQESQDLLKK